MFETAASVQWFVFPVNALINVEKRQCRKKQESSVCPDRKQL